MLVPLYGFVEGDTMGLLVLAHDDMPIREVAKKLLASAAVRVDTDRHAWALNLAGRALEPERTVTECGLVAMDRIDLRIVREEDR